MIEGLIDNKVKEDILLSLLAREDIYARDISSIFGYHLLSVQNQLKKMENGGVLVSRLKGRTRLYAFNPRYPFIKEIKVLMEKVFEFIPAKEKDKYFTPRLRPRRTGKPL